MTERQREILERYVYDRVKHIKSTRDRHLLYDQIYNHMEYTMDEDERDEILDNYES